jgi:hypothetical protein
MGGQNINHELALSTSPVHLWVTPRRYSEGIACNAGGYGCARTFFSGNASLNIIPSV